MAKPQVIQLGRDVEIPILYEDRTVLAADKPASWMLVPSHWDRTALNLQLAIDSSIRGGEFWAKSRNLRFLRFVHRLDGDTTGALLFAKSAGAVPVLSKLLETRQMEKYYLAVVNGRPEKDTWTVNAPLGSDPALPSRMRVDMKGKDARTDFQVLERRDDTALVLAIPATGRTHQIRVHLAHAGSPVLGDRIYGKSEPASEEFPLGLRSIAMGYRDPFTGRSVRIQAPADRFCREFAFEMRFPPLFPFDRKKIT